MKLMQFESLYIRDFETDIWPFPLHKHNHFELMYILKGRGIHILNNIESAYKQDTILFLLPEDKHDFIIKEKTHFNVIKFLPNILTGGINPCSNDFWSFLLEALKRKLNSNQKVEEKHIQEIKQLVQLIISEWHNRNGKITDLHANLMRALFLKLNDIYSNDTGSNCNNFENTLIDRIQNYIHINICFPEKLRIEKLSEEFNMSAISFRLKFKKEMEISLRTYINNLKLARVKEKMENSNSTLNQISQEFGFTDSSHFNRFFKNNEGISPFTYRKSLKKYKENNL